MAAPNSSSKRKRESIETASSMAIEAKMCSAAPDVALEVDVMILDYEAWAVTDALMKSYGVNEGESWHILLSSYDSFLRVFRSRYPTYKGDKALQARLLLLQFSALFVHRFSPAITTPTRTDLNTLREANITRAKRWIGREQRIPSINYEDVLDNGWPLTEDVLMRNRMNVLAMTPLGDEEAVSASDHYGTANSVCLLDILPRFIQAVALIHAMESKQTTATTLLLLAEFMLQACLEQYRFYGAHGLDSVDEAFAWGAMDEGQRDGGEHEEDVAKLFTNSADAQWLEIRAKAIERLLQPLQNGNSAHIRQSTSSMADHFETLANATPMLSFERLIMTYLVDLCEAIMIPRLKQIENGRILGVTKAQSDLILRDAELG